MKIDFFIPLKKIPTTTHQMKKVSTKGGKVRFYEPDNLKETRSLLMGWLGKFIPKEKFDGAISLKVMWLFQKRKKHSEGQFKITKPDTDNLNKLLKDCMTQCGYWDDDAQVSVEHIEKRYSSTVGIYIEIESLC